MVNGETELMKLSFIRMGETAIPLLIATLTNNRIGLLRVIAIGALNEMSQEILRKIPIPSLLLVLGKEENEQKAFEAFNRFFHKLYKAQKNSHRIT